MKQKNTTSQYITVRNSTIHGRGVFAKKDIPKDTRIIEYVGERITKAVAQKRAEIPIEKNKKNKNFGAVYLFVLNKRHDIDGNVSYNTARHINHSCEPNAETDVIRGKIWIIALRNIKKGEEILYNYGYDYDGYEEHRCCCSTNRCVGYILAEEHWQKLKKDLAKKKGSTRVGKTQQ